MAELETRTQKTRTEVATYLRDLADKLDEGGEMTLSLDGQQVTLTPTDSITFKIEGESDAEAEQSIELELYWRREAQSSGGRSSRR